MKLNTCLYIDNAGELPHVTLEQLAAQSFIEPVMSRTRATSTSREERLTSDRTETGRVSSSSWP